MSQFLMKSPYVGLLPCRCPNACMRVGHRAEVFSGFVRVGDVLRLTPYEHEVTAPTRYTVSALPVPPVAQRPADLLEQLVRTCPVCGSDLTEYRCRLRCNAPRCAYFASCNDYV